MNDSSRDQVMDSEPETQGSNAVPLLQPRDGLPNLVETDHQLARVADDLRNGAGPIAIDTERASGYRYSNRAYLIQLRRHESGTVLIDPTTVSDLQPLVAALQGCEWILHSATQDLPCLHAEGLYPSKLFDTEIAAKLLGKPKVGLSALLENELGFLLAKEHSAADWSTRPLPNDWLNYAALDVELLIELRALLLEQLQNSGRDDWAQEEFDYLLAWRAPVPVADGWRRTSGIHRIHKPRQLAIVRELWLARDAMAQHKDKAVGRILPDAAIIDIAKLEKHDRNSIFRLQSLRNRSHKALTDHWLEVVEQALAIPTKNLPEALRNTGAIPPPKAWAEKNPTAAERWSKVRPALNQRAEELGLAPEVLISPEPIRNLCWNPGNALADESELDEFLASFQVRKWQRKNVVPVILAATLASSADQ